MLETVDFTGPVSVLFQQMRNKVVSESNHYRRTVSLLYWQVYISILSPCNHSIPPCLLWGINIATLAAAALHPPLYHCSLFLPHWRPIQHPGELLQVLWLSSVRWLMSSMNCIGEIWKMKRGEMKVKLTLCDRALPVAEQGQTSQGCMFMHGAAVRARSRHDSGP